MKGRFLLSETNKSIVERNIYADKSSLVLEWLLLHGVKKKQFSLREVEDATGVGLGTVHRVFETLVFNGYLQTVGLRTNKKFLVKNATRLLQDWLEKYSLVKKCRMFAYSTGFQSREQVIEALLQSGLDQNVVLALHSATEKLKCKNTNLQQLEFYLLKPDMRAKIEKVLKLSPKEKGYDVLLIEPYYKTMLNKQVQFHTSALLTFLDLYHFPLRGIEQAEFMAERIPELKRIYKKRR